MKAMFEFECPDCDERVERFISSDVRKLACKCGGTAERVISVATIVLDGTSGDFPGAYDKWARIREDNARIKAKRNS